jgi:glycosyltransferase involved in cell wall biosynthesis/GT2 family glycosyltransferase
MDSTPGKLCLVAGELNYLVKSGGIGTSNWLLAHLLAREGWQVHVLYCGPASRPRDLARVRRQLANAGIVLTDVDDLPPPGLLQLPVERPWECARPSERVRHALEELDRSHRFDLVQFADWQGLGLRAIQAKRAGLAFADVGMIVKLHGPFQWTREVNSSWAGGVEDLLLDFCERHAFEQADFQISPSRYMLDYALRSGWKARDAAEVVLNPFDEPRFRPSGRAEGWPPELVFFGRLETRKGLEVFLTALEGLDRGIPVTFLGKENVLAAGRPASSLIRQRLKGRPFRLLTNCNREQALRYLAAGNRLAVIPPLAETFCHAVAECAVNGIPFLASRVGAIPELIPDAALQERLFFEPHPQDLLRCLHNYLGADADQRRLWQQELLEALDPEGRNREIVEFYNRSLRKVREARVAAVPGSNRLEQPLVTVAVTHYNLGPFLPEALASLAAQTYPNLEVLVIDDGSTDPASVRVFDEQEGRYPQFRFLRQRNVGLCKTRNRALAEARGDFFVPFDPDNVAMPHMVACLAAGLVRNPQVSAMTTFLLIFRDSADLARETFVGAYRPTGGPFILSSLLNVNGHASGIFRTRDLRAIGGYDEHPANGIEDRHTYIKLASSGYHLAVVPEHLYFYRLRDDSLAHTQNRYQSLRHIMELFGRTMGLTHAERMELLTALMGLYQRQEQFNEALGTLRHRVADKVNALVKKVPGVHRFCKALIVYGSNVGKGMKRLKTGQRAA